MLLLYRVVKKQLHHGLQAAGGQFQAGGQPVAAPFEGARGCLGPGVVAAWLGRSLAYGGGWFGYHTQF